VAADVGRDAATVLVVIERVEIREHRESAGGRVGAK